MRTFSTLAAVVALSVPLVGQTDPPKHALELAAALASNWQEELEVSAKTILNNATGEVRKRLEEHQEEFQGAFRWDQAKRQIARALTDRYTEQELATLHQFFSSEVGKKFAADRTALRADIMADIVMMQQRLIVVREIDAATEKLLAQLNGKEKQAVEDALKAPPIDRERLHGRWYGDDFDKDGNGYRGSLNLKPSGLSHVLGVDINHGQKEYYKYDDHGAWKLRGRLLAVAEFESPDYVRFYIVNSVSVQQLDYTFIIEEEPQSKWEKLSDSRKRVELPPRPAGYKDPYE